MKQVNRNDECPECGHSDEDENGLTELKFVGIEFDAKKIPYQQEELNRCLQAKYRIVERVQTQTGLVFVLGKTSKTSSLEELEEAENCFPKLDELPNPLESLPRGSEVA